MRGREGGREGGRKGRRKEGIKWSSLVGVVILRIQQYAIMGVVATECGNTTSLFDFVAIDVTPSESCHYSYCDFMSHL